MKNQIIFSFCEGREIERDGEKRNGKEDLFIALRGRFDGSGAYIVSEGF